MEVGDVGIGLDTLAGGGVTGMLVAVMIAFLRRTKDTDERRDDVSKAREDAARLIMDEALRREKFAWAERDRALKAVDEARAETERIRVVLEQERRQWIEERRWTRNTRETRIPPVETQEAKKLPRSDPSTDPERTSTSE